MFITTNEMNTINQFRRQLARGLIGIALLSLCSLHAWAHHGEPHDDKSWANAVTALNAGNFSGKMKAADALIGFSHPQVKPILEAWLDGLLYYRLANRQVLIMAERDKSLIAYDAGGGERLGEVSSGEVKKITINNSLRKKLRNSLAALGIRDRDADVRLNAVKQLMDNMDDDTIALLRAARAKEQDASVLAVMAEIFALEDLRGIDIQRRLAAIETLEESLRLETYNELTALSDNENEDPLLREKAKDAAQHIEVKRGFYAIVETLFFGISLGSVLMLAAIGLAITFGVMGVINMAHGELIMLGAYTAYVVQQLMPEQIGLALVIAIPAAFLVSGGFGVLLERGVIRFLYGRPLETLLATFGVSLILQQLVRSIFSPLNRPVAAPDWMSGAWQINEALSLTYNRLYILAFSLLVFFALSLIMKKTGFGLQLRATSQNRQMAKAMGVRSGRVDALSFGLGSGIAGIAGVGLSQLSNVGPNMGQAYIIDSFMVIVFGGAGNLLGTLYASMFLGTINKFFEPHSGAILAKIIVLALIILFIQKRPRGMFPQRGRAAEG